VNFPSQEVRLFTDEDGNMAMPTHCILTVLLDDIEMLRDLFFKKKLAEKPKRSGGFGSGVGTAGWKKLKEQAVV
jgi:hypothetical protein